MRKYNVPLHCVALPVIRQGLTRQNLEPSLPQTPSLFRNIATATPNRTSIAGALPVIRRPPWGLQAARRLLYSACFVVLLVLLACYLLACLLTSLLRCLAVM